MDSALRVRTPARPHARRLTRKAALERVRTCIRRTPKGTQSASPALYELPPAKSRRRPGLTDHASSRSRLICSPCLLLSKHQPTARPQGTGHRESRAGEAEHQRTPASPISCCQQACPPTLPRCSLLSSPRHRLHAARDPRRNHRHVEPPRHGLLHPNPLAMQRRTQPSL